MENFQIKYYYLDKFLILKFFILLYNLGWKIFWLCDRMECDKQKFFLIILTAYVRIYDSFDNKFF